MPANVFVLGAIIVSSMVIVLYSKIMGDNETELEKKVEEIIERNAEKSLNLPVGSLDGTLDEIEKVVEDEEDTKSK